MTEPELEAYEKDLLDRLDRAMAVSADFWPTLTIKDRIETVEWLSAKHGHLSGAPQHVYINIF